MLIMSDHIALQKNSSMNYYMVSQTNQYNSVFLFTTTTNVYEYCKNIIKKLATQCKIFEDFLLFLLFTSLLKELM